MHSADRLIATMAAAVASLLIAAPAAAGPALARTELPIRDVVQPGGAHRYAVTIRIAGAPVEVALDTGSTGLRVLPRALPPDALRAQGHAVRISYNSGTRFTGPAIDLPVGLGDAPDQVVTVQRIDAVDCREQMPGCAASRVSGEAFGIEGGGVPGQGFAAIMGIGLQANAVPNPLRTAGAHRWIVELPRPGDGTPGRLILNPDDSELSTYRRFRMTDDEANHVAGCLALAGEPPICGLAEIDTGAPGLRIASADAHEPVRPGTAAEIAIGDSTASLRATVETGRRDQATRLQFERDSKARPPHLYLGIAPYFIWSVLVDADKREVGLKPR